jgi:hypothetical protein
MSFRIALIAAASLALGACAFGDEKLNLAYDASATTVAVSDVADERAEKAAIGYKRNGFGAKTADILSVKPTAELVKEALVATLEKNGHTIGGADERFAVKTTLRKFWFDYKTGLVTVEFYGNVQAEIVVVDQQTGETMFREIFEGYHSEKTGGGLSKTWTRVMNAALADFVAKVNLSPGFKDALAAVSAAKAAPAVSAAPSGDKLGS